MDRTELFRAESHWGPPDGQESIVYLEGSQDLEGWVLNSSRVFRRTACTLTGAGPIELAIRRPGGADAGSAAATQSLELHIEVARKEVRFLSFPMADDTPKPECAGR